MLGFTTTIIICIFAVFLYSSCAVNLKVCSQFGVDIMPGSLIVCQKSVTITASVCVHKLAK